MNLFFLCACPSVAARLQCNKHINKMLIEAVQLLYNAHHYYNVGWSGAYRPSHTRHPMSIWTRRSEANYGWVHAHAVALAAVRKQRYPDSAPHASEAHLERLRSPPHAIGSASATDTYKSEQVLATCNVPPGCDPVPLCFGDDVSDCTERTASGAVDLVTSYRSYYARKMARMKMEWTIVTRKQRQRARRKSECRPQSSRKKRSSSRSMKDM